MSTTVQSTVHEVQYYILHNLTSVQYCTSSTVQILVHTEQKRMHLYVMKAIVQEAI